MAAVGMIVLWGGYSIALWGYCLIRGYDITFTQLVKPSGYYAGPWPPAGTIAAGSVLPGGTAVTAAAKVNTTAQITPAGGAAAPVAGSPGPGTQIV
jgi:hypothetical protein